MRKQLGICFILAILSLGAIPSVAQNFSADPLTGKPIGNIPIWTVNSGDLAAGISLSYYGSPKVNDTESTAGMGWSLIAGGGVYRQVRGLPDDLIATPSDSRIGWLHGATARGINLFTPAGDPTNQTCLSGEATTWWTLSGFMNTDTEPDIFSFNAPGLSGQFIFDGNRVVQTIPYQDLKIQVTREASDSLISQIVITNNKGVKYTFQVGDLTVRSATNTYTSTKPMLFRGLYNLYKTKATYYSSWYLRQITSPNGGVISFGYGSSFTTTTPVFKRVVDATTNTIDTLFVDNSVTTSQLLQTITGSNELATFVWTGSSISSVVISDLTYGTLTKNFNLQYNYVTGAIQSGYTRPVKRAYLSSLAETLNCNAFPGYSFTYYGVNFNTNSTTIPFNTGIKQDLFGYYDSTATSAVPDIYIKSGDTGTDGERYRIAAASSLGYSLMGSGGGSRIVDASKVYFGSLRAVTLPSGGSTTFTYEAADYYDAPTSSSVLGGGPRVKTIKVSANDPSDVTTTYKYRTTSSVSSGQWVYRPVYVAFDTTLAARRVPDNLAPSESILYSRVEASTTGRGKTVYEFQNLGMYPVTSANGDFNATLSLVVRPSCNAMGSLRPGYYSYPYTTNTNYDFERGLPTRITDYARNGNMVQRKTYTYQRTTLSVAQVSGIGYEPLGLIFQFGKYTLLSNVNKVTATQASRVYDQTTAALDTTKFVETVSTYTYNGNQMLSQIATTDSDNSTLYNTYKYAKDYPSSGTDSLSMMINALVSNNQHGTLVESVSLNGTAVTGGSLTLFRNTFSGTTAILPKQQLILGDPTGFTNSTVSGGTFNYSSNYYPVAYYDAYDAVGHPLIMRDQSRAVRSSILGYNNSAVALDIANARYDQVAFSDFEPDAGTGSKLISTAATTTADSWSGQYSTALTSSTNISQSSVARGIGKNYRFSCWAKASAATTLSIQINGTTLGTVTYGSSVTGTWQYMETIVNMSSITSAFAFKVITSGNISLDNVAFYPESSTVAHHAYDPLNGKTADLDSRGVSGFQDYDALGRPRYMRNMDKDVVQIKDYHYTSSNGILPVSSFTGNVSPNMGVSTVYTPNPTCTSGVSYAWTVATSAGVVLQTSTASTLSYTFTVNQTYRITLVASASFGTTSTDMVVTPVPVVTASISSGASHNFNCFSTGTPVAMTATAGGCLNDKNGNPSNITYTWYAVVNGATMLLSTTTTTSTTNTYSYSLTPNFNNQVYCVITTYCGNVTTRNNDPLTVTTGSFNFNWIPGGNC